MKYKREDYFNLPNIVSYVRILMTPILLTLAYQQQPVAFMWLLVFTLFTDVLDGFLARLLNQITELGSHLDSWGDFFVYSTLAVSAWWLWPDIVLRELPFVLTIIVSFIAPVLIGLIKFHTLTSYHTWSVKLAVGATTISYIIIFSGWATWPFQLAAILAAIAAIEEISITFMMRHEHADIRSIWHAIRINQTEDADS